MRRAACLALLIVGQAEGGTQSVSFSGSGPLAAWPDVPIPKFNQARGTLYEAHACLTMNATISGKAYTVTAPLTRDALMGVSASLAYYDATGQVGVVGVGANSPDSITGVNGGAPASFSASAFGCADVPTGQRLIILANGSCHCFASAGLEIIQDDTADNFIWFNSSPATGSFAGTIDYKYVADTPFPPTPHDPPDIDDLPPYPELDWTPSAKDFDGNKAEIRVTNAPTDPPIDPQTPLWVASHVPPGAQSVQVTAANNEVAGGMGPEGLHSCTWYEWRVTAINGEASASSPWIRFRIGVAGDINHDSMADDADFTLFVVGYNLLDCLDPTMPVHCPADFNHDGMVDDADFIVFVRGYDTLICL